MSLDKTLRIAIIGLSAFFAFQSSILLYFFARDYRGGENGITKGLITLSAGLVVGGLTTVIDRMVRLVKGQSLPMWLQICRVVSHILCVIGMHLVYWTIKKEHDDN